MVSVVMAEMLGYSVKKHNFGIQISTADQRDGGLSGSTSTTPIDLGLRGRLATLDRELVGGLTQARASNSRSLCAAA